MSDIFETLGVSPDATLREIKRAYALKLKACDQQNDVQRFQELRQAYEVACQFIRHNEAFNDHNAPGESEQNAASDSIPSGELDQRHSKIDVSLNTPRQNSDNQRLAIQQIEASDATAEERPTSDIDIDVAPSARQVQPVYVDYAAQVVASLKQEVKANPDLDASETLQRFARVPELIPLDERERFEQLLLEWLFENTVNIKWLDAASDLFVWYSANQHLYAHRYDLALRVRNHIELRHMILDQTFDAEILAQGQYYYHISLQRDSRMYQMLIPYAVLKELARVLERIESMYPQEVKERFRSELIYWKSEIREQLGATNTAAAPTASAPPSSKKSLAFIPAMAVLYFILQIGMLATKPIPQQAPPVVRPSISMGGDTKALGSSSACIFSDKELRQILATGVQLNGLMALECMERIQALRPPVRTSDKPS